MRIKDQLLYAGAQKALFNRLRPSMIEKNRQNLCVFSIMGLIFMLALLFVSHYEHSLVKNRLLYEIFGGTCFIMYNTCRFTHDQRITLAAMYIFDFSLLAFGIALGTWIDPNNLAVVYTVVLFIIPLLFCARPIYVILLILFSIAVFFICALFSQTSEMINWNATNIIPFGLLSVSLCPYIIGLKVDHTIVDTQKRTLKGFLPLGEDGATDQLKMVVNFVQIMMNYHTDESLLHCKRVEKYSQLLCRAHNHLFRNEPEKLFTEKEIQIIGVGAELHDIGKIYVPDAILHKTESLTEAEWNTVRNHTVVGAQLINHVAAICHADSTILNNIIRYHHERWDGSGYPEQLIGEQIPLEAQLVAIAEVYDSLTQENYSKKRSHDEAFRMITSGECGAFSPLALQCFEFAKNDFSIITENKEENRWNLLERVYAKQGKLYWHIKRAFDICAAGAALLVLSPILLLVAAWIKIDDPKSPVIFKQERLGRHKKPFKMYKFRTMVPNAEQLLKELEKENEKDGPVFKIKKDPRITKPGHFLRKTSLDELPQLINIIKGDMTVVGPRPPLASEVEKYSRYHEMRLSITPGLTCYWQAQKSRDDVPFEEWMDMDIAYIGTRSVYTDIKIILKTMMSVLRGSGN